MSGKDIARTFRSSRPAPHTPTRVGIWPISLVLVSLGFVASAFFINLDKLPFASLLPAFLQRVPAAEQALLILTAEQNPRSISSLDLSVYPMTAAKFRAAPFDIQEKLLRALQAYQLDAPQWAVLGSISDLDTSEPNTAMMRGLSLAKSGGDWGIGLIRSAAEKGLVPAQALYGIALVANPSLQPKEGRSGRDWLGKAIAAGDADASYSLGYAILQDRVSGTTPAEGVELLRRASQAGSIAAMKLLAALLARGHLVPKDLPAAENYALKAANTGDSGSQALFGMYLVALAVSGQPERLSEAVRHFTNASKSESIDIRRKAMDSLGMIRVEWAKEAPLRDLAEGVRWFQRCADWAYRGCYYALANAYETGQGIGSDSVKAAAYYKAAHELGERQGREGYNRVAKLLTTAEQEKAAADAKALIGRSGAVEHCIEIRTTAKDCFILPDGRLPTFKETIRSTLPTLDR